MDTEQSSQFLNGFSISSSLRNEWNEFSWGAPLISFSLRQHPRIISKKRAISGTKFSTTKKSFEKIDVHMIYDTRREWSWYCIVTESYVVDRAYLDRWIDWFYIYFWVRDDNNELQLTGNYIHIHCFHVITWSLILTRGKTLGIARMDWFYCMDLYKISYTIPLNRVNGFF